MTIAQARLSERNFAEAISLSNEAIDGAGQKDPEIAIDSRYTLGLANARSGDAKQGLKFCDEALESGIQIGRLHVSFPSVFAEG